MKYWKWACQNCKHEFVLINTRIPDFRCRRCAQEVGYDKIKEQETKQG
jgi:PHP family Zn ribbon phosphoesterase